MFKENVLQMTMGEELKEEFMRRALTLAEKGGGRTSPNPLVGAVLVKDGRVISEGYHSKAGQPHAEVHALDRVREAASGATLFVTLEPCNFFGKTPPCTDRLIDSGISRIVIGLTDPNPRVSGQGIARLKQAGIDVEHGVLAEEVERQNETYVKHITSGSPFVMLKTAVSLDGKITAEKGRPFRLTGHEGQRLVHALRSEYDAVLVGIGTVLSDDPRLTARIEGGRNPIRVIVDSRARLPEESFLASSARRTRTLLAATSKASKAKVNRLADLGVEVWKTREKDGRVDLRHLLSELGRDDITSVLVEGGSEIAATLAADGLIDKYVFLISPQLIGGLDVPGVLRHRLAEPHKLRIAEARMWGQDLVVEAYPEPLSDSSDKGIESAAHEIEVSNR